MKVSVTQLCLALDDPMVCPWNSPGKNTEWVAISLSRGSSWPRDRTQVSCIAVRFFTIWSTREFISVQSLSCVWLFATPWTAACQASLSITNSRSLLIMTIMSVMPSNHLILCCPHLLMPSILPSIKVFSNQSVLCIRWPKYQSFSFSISPFYEYSWLISLRIDKFDLFAAHGTVKSLPQYHSSKASILRHLAFFIVQLSHLYMTTGKTIALTRRTFVSKVMSLLFNMLSGVVIAFLPRSKYLLISWL